MCTAAFAAIENGNLVWRAATAAGKTETSKKERHDKMTGTTTKKKRKDGSISWGYSFFAGRIEKDGKRVRDQRTKGGFETGARLRMRCANAIEEHKRTPAAERTVPTFRRVLRALSPRMRQPRVLAEDGRENAGTGAVCDPALRRCASRSTDYGATED